MTELAETTRAEDAAPADAEVRKRRLAAAGGILGAIVASSCCIIPLLLVSAGLGGAWLGNLTALAPYKPIFLTVTAGFLGYGFWLVYRRPRVCAADQACARPLPDRWVRIGLWSGAALAVLSLLWSWIAPVVAPILLGL